MKKILVLLSALVVLLCGCSMKDVKSDGSDKYNQPLPESFSAVLTVTQYSVESKASIQYSLSGETYLSYLYPDIASSMRIIRSDTGVRVEYLGLNYENTYNILPKSNVITVMDGVCNAVLLPDNYTVKQSAEAVTYYGKYNEVPFSLVRDKKTLVPISLSVEAYDLYIAFSEFNN